MGLFNLPKSSGICWTGNGRKSFGPLNFSVRFECVLVVGLQIWVLLCFVQNAITGNEHFDFGAHKAAECVLWRANDGLAPHIETGVNEHGAAGQLLEMRQQRVISGIRIIVDSLYAG